MTPDDDNIALHRDTIVSHLRDLAGEAIDSDDPHHVGRVLVAFDRIAELVNGKRGELGYRGEVEAHLLACLDGRAISAVAVGRFKLVRRLSKPRKAWQFDDLLHEVVVRARKEATGELEASEWTVARWIQDCVGFSYGKVTGLRKLGIDPDEFCETGTAVATIDRQEVEGEDGKPVF